MKVLIYTVLTTLWAAMSQAQSSQPSQSQVIVAGQSRPRPVVMERAEQWTMRSKAGRIYEISVARPSAAAPAHGYPVMYVLDPSTAFATLVDTVRNQEQMFDPVVVVGVGYASDAEEDNRTLDLTPPTNPANLPAGMPNGWGATGGNDAFLSFLVDELKPAIAKAMVVNPSRQALFGHSLGGLFVLHALFVRSDSFDTYIAGSPSIWWDNKAILSEVAVFKAAQQRTKVHRRLLITVGELEAIASPEEIRLGAALKIGDPMKLMREAHQVENSAELTASLTSLAANGLDVHRVAFPDETHNSVIPAYLARGARFTLTGWYE